MVTKVQMASRKTVIFWRLLLSATMRKSAWLR